MRIPSDEKTPECTFLFSKDSDPRASHASFQRDMALSIAEYEEIEDGIQSILGSVYLSGITPAQNKNLLFELGITHVLTVGTGLPIFFAGVESVVSLRFDF